MVAYAGFVLEVGAAKPPVRLGRPDTFAARGRDLARASLPLSTM